MSYYKFLTSEDINDFLQQYDVPLEHVESDTYAVRVLFEIIKCQAEQIAELKIDIECLAEMSGFGGCL